MHHKRGTLFTVVIVATGAVALLCTAFASGLWLLLLQVLTVACLMFGAYRFSAKKVTSINNQQDKDE